MSIARIFKELNVLGIRIVAHGDRIRYSPRSQMTPDLADRIVAHRAEVLAVLNGDPEALSALAVEAIWQATLDELKSDPTIPPEVAEALQTVVCREVKP